MKILEANPYTFKVTKKKLYFTAEFKEIFWTGYQAGTTPRKLLEDMGYNLEIFSQKQIDSIVQRIKRQAQSGYGFTESEKRIRRMKYETANTENIQDGSPNITVQIWNEVKYLRQEVELKKNCENGKCQKGKKSMSAGWKFEVIHETLKGKDNLLNVSMLCDIAGVSRSGYYRWIQPESIRKERENKDRQDLKDEHIIPIS